jgi:PadR family transcriptional regulator PadR
VSTNSQMLKGIMEGCILAIIAAEEVYGYELSRKLEQMGFPQVSEGSIYPLLLRMQKEKWIAGTLRQSPAGPQRKYYRLTDQGKMELARFIQQWDQLSNAVDRVLLRLRDKD